MPLGLEDQESNLSSVNAQCLDRWLRDNQEKWRYMVDVLSRQNSLDSSLQTKALVVIGGENVCVDYQKATLYAALGPFVK